MVNCKVILVISNIGNWLKKGDSRSSEGTEEQTCLLAEHAQLVPGWQLEGLFQDRVGNLVGRKSRCLNHYLLENRVWVKQEVGAAPAPPCTCPLPELRKALKASECPCPCRETRHNSVSLQGLGLWYPIMWPGPRR